MPNHYFYYLGINLEDQQHEQSDDNYASSLYRQRRWHEKYNWPRLQKEYFGDGQVQPKFNARIAEEYRKIRNMLNKQTTELKQRIQNSMNNFAMPDDRDSDEEEDFRALMGEGIDSRYSPNSNQQQQQQQQQPQQQHVLEDVRPYPPQDGSDFSFREGEDVEDDEGGEMVDNIPEEDNVDLMRVAGTNYNAEEIYGDLDGYRSGGLYDAKLADPTHFAYSPPDPRFYEDLVRPGKYSEHTYIGFLTMRKDVAYIRSAFFYRYLQIN